MIGKWNKSVVLTYVGLSASICGIILTIMDITFIKYAYILLIVAGICDLFDGVVARKCKRNDEEKQFGVELDSLVDVISFLAFPITLLCASGLNHWYDIPLFILFGIFGIARLGYFNIKAANSEKAVEYYEGLSVTYTALIFPILYLLTLCLSRDIIVVIIELFTLIVSLLFALKIKIKKPRGIAYIIFAILSILAITAYILFI